MKIKGFNHIRRLNKSILIQKKIHQSKIQTKIGPKIFVQGQKQKDLDDDTTFQLKPMVVRMRVGWCIGINFEMSTNIFTAEAIRLISRLFGD